MQCSPTVSATRCRLAGSQPGTVARFGLAGLGAGDGGEVWAGGLGAGDGGEVWAGGLGAGDGGEVWAGGLGAGDGGEAAGSGAARSAGRALAGGIRTQYQHVTDVFPTLAELCGVKVADTRHGVPVPETVGASFAATLQDPGAPSTLPEQYYEMIGHRGFYRDGWSIRHLPPSTAGVQ